MNLRHLLLMTLCLAASAARAADDPVFSGPQPGEKLTPFKVFVASGSRKGSDISPIAEFAGAPTVIAFVHELPRTRNQKVMRRVIRSILAQQPLGDLSSLADPRTLDGIRDATRFHLRNH